MFQYCAYYGLSAPLLMVLSKQQIDKLFEIPLHKNTAVLLENLQWELEKLKQILGNKANVPTVPDESSVITSYFLRGVNAALLDKDKYDAEQDTPVTLDTDLASSLDGLDLDSTTDLFGSLDTTPEHTTLTLSADDDMIEIPLENESDDIDVDWSFGSDDMSLDLEDTADLSLSLEDTADMPNVFDEEESKSDWVMPSDLIARGRMLSATEADRFKSFSQFTLWMCNKARAELGAENYEILQSQFETLPLKLRERITLDKKNYNLKQEYPKLYSILNTLVVQSCSTVDDKPKIDYVLDKISSVINQSSSQTAMFLGVNFDLLKNLGNIWAFNTRINEAVVTGPLSTQSIQSKRRIVDSLLEDCRTLLGIDEKGNKVATTRTSSSQHHGQRTVPAANSDTLDQLMQGEKFRDLMESEDREASIEAIQQIRQSGNEGYTPLTYMYTNPMEIIFQMRIRIALQDLSKNILAEFGIAGLVEDPDEINELGIELAKKFKIGGLYYGYDDIFRSKCLAIKQCCNQTDFSIAPDSDNKYYDSLYTEIQLVYVYLLSLKARIGNA